MHLGESIYKKFFLTKSILSWVLLILSFFGVLFINFTGYLLRSDEVGELAGAIGENLLLSIPYLGESLNKIFLAPSLIRLHRLYHWHLFLSFLLLTGLFIGHTKFKTLFSWKNLPYFLGPLFPAIFFQFPLKPFQDFQARSPWFFVGAQEMLKFLPPLLVLFYLSLFFFLLLGYVLFPSKYKLLNLSLFFYLLSYLFLSLIFFI